MDVVIASALFILVVAAVIVCRHTSAWWASRTRRGPVDEQRAALNGRPLGGVTRVRR
jgi:hypothetical protein